MNTSDELIKKLESIYKVFLSIKILFEIHIPENTYVIKNSYFQYMTTEANKLICGRLFMLICDTQSRKDHNTISLMILMDQIKAEWQADRFEPVKRFHDDFAEIYKQILALAKNDKLKSFRDKVFAHTDLSDNNELIPLSDFKISNKTISDMFSLCASACETIRLFVSDASTDQMHEPIQSLSQKIWESYEAIGLVQKKFN
jgi:hypothetical protein